MPDRIVLTRQRLPAHDRSRPQGSPRHLRPRRGGAAARCRTSWSASRASTPGEAVTLGRLLRKCEGIGRRAGRDRMGARRDGLQAVAVAAAARGAGASCPTRSGCKHPGLNGHPAGIGWGAGRAVVVNCECELSRVAPGDMLVTRVAGPALSHILPRVAGVVAELGGSTSHLASLARERGIPMVLGVLDATRKHSRRRRRSRSTASPASCGGCDDGQTARLCHASRSQTARSIACALSPPSRSIPDSSRIIAKPKLIAAVKKCDILFSSAA